LNDHSAGREGEEAGAAPAGSRASIASGVDHVVECDTPASATIATRAAAEVAPHAQGHVHRLVSTVSSGTDHSNGAITTTPASPCASAPPSSPGC
jgi:hypothetical protein